MEQNVGMAGAAEVVEDDLHEIEASRALLTIAYEQGTIDDEDLFLFTSALDEEERKGSVLEADIPGARFRLDAQSVSSCLSVLRFTKAYFRRLCSLANSPKQPVIFPTAIFTCDRNMLTFFLSTMTFLIFASSTI